MDVQRLNDETATSTRERIERGQRLLRAWLKLVSLTVDPAEGCKRCGRTACTGGRPCITATSDLLDFSRRVPLNGVHGNMDAPRWRNAMIAMIRPDVAPVRELFWRT